MASVQNEVDCISCGKVYWVDTCCKTGGTEKISQCDCDRDHYAAKEFIKEKGLTEEFLNWKRENEEEEEL